MDEKELEGKAIVNTDNRLCSIYKRNEAEANIRVKLWKSRFYGLFVCRSCIAEKSRDELVQAVKSAHVGSVIM